MKSFLFGIVALLLITTINFGCKKNTDEVNIIGKWTAKGSETHEFYSGSSHYSTSSANANAYIEFKSDGSFFAVSVTSFSTGSWSKTNNKLTVISNGSNAEVWIIKKLTGSDLELYWTDKDLYPTDYVELTAYFGR
jgi:hypothetical protein